MYRISHGSINAATRRDSTPDLSKKATSNNMNGTINATTRRNIGEFEFKPAIQEPPSNPQQVVTTPVQTPPKPILIPKPTPTQTPIQIQKPITQNPVPIQKPVTQIPIPILTPLTTPTPSPVPPPPTTSILQQPTNQQQAQNLQQLSEIKDQYVKISMSLNQVNAGSGAVKRELESYKKLTDERIDRMANLFLSIYNHSENCDIDLNNIKNELCSYKKLTDERIEKIANLFLSINK
jgi:hypothetical protein